MWNHERPLCSKCKAEIFIVCYFCMRNACMTWDKTRTHTIQDNNWNEVGKKIQEIRTIIRVSVSPPINETIWNAHTIALYAICVDMPAEVVPLSQSQYDNNWALLKYEGGISQVIAIFGVQYAVFDLIIELMNSLLQGYCEQTHKYQSMLLLNPTFPFSCCKQQRPNLNWCDAENMLVIILCMRMLCVVKWTTVCGRQ